MSPVVSVCTIDALNSSQPAFSRSHFSNTGGFLRVLDVEIKIGKWSLWCSLEVVLQLNDTAIVGDAIERSIALNVQCRDEKCVEKP